jgi:hypothetical protein
MAGPGIADRITFAVMRSATTGADGQAGFLLKCHLLDARMCCVTYYSGLI